MFKVPVIYNVRQKDISSGGNGAPLMPFLDWLIFKNYDKIILTLNLGGIANISLITESGNRNEVKGFDVGPGMSLIDEVCKRFCICIMYILWGRIQNQLQRQSVPFE